MLTPKRLANETLFAYLLLILTAVAIAFIAHYNLNRVTVSGLGYTTIKRVDNISVEKVLKNVGYFRLAEKLAIRIVDDEKEINETGQYLLVNHKLGEKISGDLKIKLFSYRVEKIVETRSLPYKTVYKKTHELLPGEKKVVQKGVQGKEKRTYKNTYQDGRIKGQRLIACAIVAEAVPQIVEEGAPLAKVSPSSRGKQAKIKEGTHKVIATAYTHTGFRTAVGIKPRRGIVAVDPKVIPLGTRMYVEGYGYAVAADTGGAIKGNKIDVFFESRAEAVKWGRRNVEITIMG